MIAQQGAMFAAALYLLSAGPAAGQSWLETRIAIEELIEADNHEAAAALSDQLLEDIAAEFGEVSAEFAEAQMVLGHVELGNDEFIGAEDRILKAIAIYEDIDGPTTARLIEPYTLLGEVLYAQGAYPPALEAFTIARQLGRRAYGVLNEDQMILLDQMAQTALANDDRREAEQLRAEAVTLVQRIHGEASLEYVEASLQHADWLRRNAEGRGAASFTVNSLWTTIDNFAGDHPVVAVNALRLYSKRASRNLNGPVYGTNLALNKALRIVRKLDEPDPLLQAEVLRDLGDWNLASGRFDATEENYAEAWALLEAIEGGEAIQREWFGEPSILRSYAMRVSPEIANVLTQTPESIRGRIELEFEVDAYGRPGKARVTEANPPNLLDNEALRALSSFSFRPAMRDGDFVPAGSRYAWEYYYDPGRAAQIGAR
jgi:TonB family protein